MPTSPFVVPAGWTITSWHFDDQVVPEGIPHNAFPVPGTLQITHQPTFDSYNLTWSTGGGQAASAPGLHTDPLLDPSATKLEGQNLVVTFGTQEVECTLTLTLDLPLTNPKTLTGTIFVVNPDVRGDVGPETGSGTFTATANPGT